VRPSSLSKLNSPVALVVAVRGGLDEIRTTAPATA